MEDREQKENSTASLEENFARLEELIDVLSGEEVSLEAAFRAYSKGISILLECNEQIDRVEKQVLMLTGNGELTPLDEE